MGFFLLGKRRDGSELQLIADNLYATRQDAIDALSAINVPADLDSEVFVVDLDSATPVVVVQKRDSQEVAPTVDESPQAAAEEAAEEDGLHNALKGAAASLEDSGISAPDSIGPLDEEPQPPADQEGHVETAQADKAWPWAPGDSPTEEPAESDADGDLDEVIAQSVPAEEYVPDPLEEPAVAVGDMLSSPEAEDVDTAQPVIMGSYRDDTTPDGSDEIVITDEPMPEPAFDGAPQTIGNEKARNDLETVLADLEIPEPEPATVTPETQTEPEALVEPTNPPEPDARLDEATKPDASPSEAEPVATEVADLMGETDVDLAATDESGFEAGGSDLGDLTCDDCVYMNTCPKKGESDPSSCGSFQWKSS